VTIEHTGTGVPTDPILFDPQNTEWVEQAWDDDVDTHGAIQTSAWVVPSEWTVETSEGPVPVSAGGVTYTNGTRARLTTTATRGLHIITNRVTFNDGTQLDRSRLLRVATA